METTIMENQMEKKMENEMDTREYICQGPHDLQKPNAILVRSPVLQAMPLPKPLQSLPHPMPSPDTRKKTLDAKHETGLLLRN